MPDLDRVVAGLSCREVLNLLSEYVDGDLAPETVAQVRAHLSGCDHCERFGGAFGELVSRLGRDLLAGEGIAPEMRRKLAERMKSEWEGEGRE